jgi:hypothetical protein
MTDRETVTTPTIEPTRAVMPERERVRMRYGIKRDGVWAFVGFILFSRVPWDAMPYLTDDVRPFDGMVEVSEGAAAARDGARFLHEHVAVDPASYATTQGARHAFRPLLQYGDSNTMAVYRGHLVVVVVRGGSVVAVLSPQALTHESVLHNGRHLGTVAHTPDLDIHGRTWGTGADPMGMRITTPYDGTEGSQTAKEVL